MATGKPVSEGVCREYIIKELKNANLSISWARVTHWLNNQACDPGKTLLSSVKPSHWAFDRAFYLNCRKANINVPKVMVRPSLKSIRLC